MLVSVDVFGAIPDYLMKDELFSKILSFSKMPSQCMIFMIRQASIMRITKSP